MQAIVRTSSIIPTPGEDDAPPVQRTKSGVLPSPNDDEEEDWLSFVFPFKSPTFINWTYSF